MSSNSCSVLKSTIKRKSEFAKTNKIRLALFSFAQTELNEKQKLEKKFFSFSNQSFEKTNEKPESKFITKKFSLNSNSYKTANDSLDMSSDEEESSQMSCDEEEI